MLFQGPWTVMIFLITWTVMIKRQITEKRKPPGTCWWLTVRLGTETLRVICRSACVSSSGGFISCFQCCHVSVTRSD
jgi:hypothetical protein